ncbi:AAA family ATPase [Streptomyces sp. NPDC058305]|uniref:AAA family ATPase n=1 Tax=Streptomyces sp. NPDC058305 TaxID=3346438 RepID=UPI0036F18C4F
MQGKENRAQVELANKLRELVEERYRTNFTQAGLAKRVKLSPVTISRALSERSPTRPNVKTVDAFIKAFCAQPGDHSRIVELKRLQSEAWNWEPPLGFGKVEDHDAASITSAARWGEFTRPPDGLADDLLAPEFLTHIDLLTRDFVGRREFAAAVDREIADPAFRSGYVLVTGEPGIGKSSFLAHLVRERGWLHHFNSVSGYSTTEYFLRNVCAQLILRHQLNHAALPARAGQNSMFLQSLLDEVTRRQEQPLIIAVDAIDEASDINLPPGSNRLSLPVHLPDNVYVVVTSRGRHAYELDAQNIREIKIEDRSQANLDDLALYVNRFIDRNADRMAPFLLAASKRGDDFTEAFLERSDGNFLYATRVLPEIANGTFTDVDDVRSLPHGLVEYYHRHWTTMRTQAPKLFDEVHGPVIKAFALVNETSAEVIAKDWDLPLLQVRRALAVWREFLNEVHFHADFPRYRIYHKSFLDFLRSEVDLRDTQQKMVDTAVRRVTARGGDDFDDLDDLDDDNE